ncbi:Alpha-galactosidase 1 [Trichoderma ghanense]|uniref:Alpha-galactosidase n=1 Tax=Trichoderma ghanense TaxID=65468 RepID=A0ABY2H7L9_9HYPO
MRFPREGLLVALSASTVRAVNNGLARTPQMGWNNWNTLACSVSSTLLTDTAQLLTEYGLQDLGYKYVVLDDCWSSGRDADGKLVADESKFPGGMGALADALHEKGFLFGMYSSAGEMTCARYGELALSCLCLGLCCVTITSSIIIVILVLPPNRPCRHKVEGENSTDTFVRTQPAPSTTKRRTRRASPPGASTTSSTTTATTWAASARP